MKRRGSGKPGGKKWRKCKKKDGKWGLLKTEIRMTWGGGGNPAKALGKLHPEGKNKTTRKIRDIKMEQAKRLKDPLPP